jgi:hypothetical protein
VITAITFLGSKSPITVYLPNLKHIENKYSLGMEGRFFKPALKNLDDSR